MKKIYLTTLLTTLLGVLGVKAQVTTEPSPLQEDSENVWIYFHADQGNKGLANLPASTEIYAHTGVITNQSVNDQDWKYVVAEWFQNVDKCKLQYVSDNLWKLYIGNIRTFYNITDPNVSVKKLAFVFRNSNGSKEGKSSSNGDIMVDVLAEGLQVALQSSIYNELVGAQTGPVNFTVTSTIKANLSLSVNGTLVKSADNATVLQVPYTFSGVGDYLVTATATADGNTVTASRSYAYLGEPTQKAYPGNGGVPVMGPVTNSDGSVTFCMAAPEMSNMIIVGSWNDYSISSGQQMYYTDYNTLNPVTGESGVMRYFWTTIGKDQVNDPDKMYIYYFIVNGTIRNAAGTETVTVKTCDPYARLVLDPWNDKYLITDVFPNLPEYPYSHIEGVPVAVYQANINNYNWECKDFCIPDKDNLIIYELLLRDFTGTEGKADGNGTVQQAIAKLDYLKKLGVNAIELLPICEFNGNNSWGYNPNFYFAVDKAYGTPDDYKEFIDLCHKNGMAVILDMVFNQSDGLHPWYQMYGGAEYSPFYNQNAPHAYSVLNDWNQGYALVQQQWTDVIKYWLTEYNFDGFRFDLVKGLGLNDSYRNNSDAATNEYNASRVAEMKYLNSVIQSVKPGAYCINENLAGPTEENEMAADGEINWANVNDAACQFAMGYSDNSNMNRLYALQDSRTWGSTVSYLESHDEQRLAYKQDQWGVSGVKGNVETSMRRLGSAAVQMIMTPGSHMIWQFSEMGNAENTKNSDNGNNTSPKKVNWSLLDEPNHKGLYESYSQLIGIRFANPQFFTQQANFSIACGQNNWSLGRYLYSTTTNGEVLLTFINPNVTGASLTFSYNFPVKDNSAYKIMSQSYNSNSSFDAVNGTVTVPANCYVVIGSVSLEDAGVEGVEIQPAKSLKVYGGFGEVVVESANGLATVYSLDGHIVGKVNESGRVACPSGLYIVKSVNESVKVIVK